MGDNMFRKIILRVLEVSAFDFTIRNPWTGTKFFLHSFTHKTYWWRGRSREKKAMEILDNLFVQGQRFSRWVDIFHSIFVILLVPEEM